MNRSIILASLAVGLLVSGCGLTPDTMLNAARGKAAALPLALALQECVTDTPAEADFAPHFNAVLDKLDLVEGVEFDRTLISVFANSKAEVQDTKDHWNAARTVLVENDITCNAFVVQEAANIEKTFLEIETAMLANERVVYYGEYAITIARLFGLVEGERVTVERMEVPA